MSTVSPSDGAELRAVAVLGIGTIGRGVAANLVATGHHVTIWNRTPTHLTGATTAASVAQAVTGRDTVLLCLSDDEAVRTVSLGPDGILTHATPGTVVVDMSTISPGLSDEEHTAYAARGVELLDAPVFGSRDEAAAAGLWIVVGGDPDILGRVRPVLDAVSATVHHMGPAGSGARTKLVGNLLVAAQLHSLGEALVLARAAGLDLRTVLDVVAVTDFRTPIYSGVGPAVLAGDYTPAFALTLMHKDAHLITDYAASLDVPVPATRTITGTLDRALADGLGQLNASALIQVLATDAGVDLTG